MSRADQLLVQTRTKIDKIGQWIAIRRYAGIGVDRTGTDTLTKAYIRYEPAKEFVGSVVQNYAVVYALAEPFNGWHPPINTNDKLVTGFTGFDDFGSTPSLNGESRVTSGKETAISSVEKIAPGGKTIALKLRAVG